MHNKNKLIVFVFFIISFAILYNIQFEFTGMVEYDVSAKISPVRVGFMEPKNNTYLNTKYVNFTYNISRGGNEGDTCELLLQKNGIWEVNKTDYNPEFSETTVGVNNTFNITMEPININWTIQCNDTMNLKENASINPFSDAESTFFNFSVIDNRNPVVSLINPENNTYKNNLEQINFTFNVTDNFAIDSCSIFINDTLNSTDYIITEIVNQTFNLSFDTYRNLNWTIQCNDTSGNIANSTTHNYSLIEFVAEEQAETPQEAPSEGGNSRSSSTQQQEKEQDGQEEEQEEQENEGQEEIKKQELKTEQPKQKDVLDISSKEQSSGVVQQKSGGENFVKLGKKGTHKIKVVEVKKDRARIRIESEPIEFELIIGESRNVDVDYDGVDDIIVTLDNIVNGETVISIKNIEYEQENIFDETNKKTKEEPKKPNYLFFIIFILSILLILIFYFEQRIEGLIDVLDNKFKK